MGVMLFFLVLFVLLSIYTIPSCGLKTDLPQSGAQIQSEPKSPVIISLSKEGEIAVGQVDVTEDTLVSGNKHQANGDQELTVIVKGDAGTTDQQMVDVMDKMRDGGISHVSIATKMRS
jgi:biopolymer transport protein TolR